MRKVETRRLSPIFMVAAACALAQAQPRIVYTKSFPGSVPAYVEIRLEKDGTAEYREDPADDSPLKFRLSGAEVNDIFSLADKLDRFKRPLEVTGLRVANMGMKTFRYENGAERNQVKFNFSQDPDARLLHDWFERISETELHLVSLERTARFDKLGVYKALLQLEESRDRKRLVATEQFLPMLDRIAKNESYVHVARERAASLADGFRAKLKAE